MDKKNILANKKIIVKSLIAFLILIIFWFFIYLPNRNYLSKIKLEVPGLENQIKRIEETMRQAKTVEGTAKLLNNRYLELNEKFFQRDEEGLDMLSVFARRANIEVVSVKASPKAAFTDQSGAKIDFQGKALQAEVVTMEMKCFYRDLVRYLEFLNSTFPALLSCEKMKITRENPKSIRLNVTLELKLYSLL